MRRFQKGTVNLAVALIILSAMTLTLFYSTNSVIVEQRVYSNLYQTEQAESAAQAGIEYGVRYLQKNKSTLVTDPDNNGYISPPTVSKTLTNSSSYSIVYQNPTAYDFDLIKMLVTATSSDTSSQKVIHQIVKWQSLLAYAPPLPATFKGEVDMSGNSNITNLVGNYTIWSGDEVDLNGSASTTTASGGSSRGNIQADIIQDAAALANATTDQFFANFFGTSKSVISASTNLYFQNSGNTSYNASLANETNVSVWIEQTTGEASIDQSTNVGTASQPVLIIVNGDLELAGSAVIYGVIYTAKATSTITFRSNAQVNGMVIGEGELNADASQAIVYDSTVVTNVKKNIGSFERVSGAWNDLSL